MATVKSDTSDQDRVVTQFLANSAVLTEFPAIQLSGSGVARFKVARALLTATPADNHILDEEGDVLCVSFVTSNPYQFVYTKKGLRRLELETSVAPGL